MYSEEWVTSIWAFLQSLKCFHTWRVRGITAAVVIPTSDFRIEHVLKVCYLITQHLLTASHLFINIQSTDTLCFKPYSLDHISLLYSHRLSSTIRNKPGKVATHKNKEKTDPSWLLRPFYSKWTCMVCSKVQVFSTAVRGLANIVALSRTYAMFKNFANVCGIPFAKTNLREYLWNSVC